MVKEDSIFAQPGMNAVAAMTALAFSGFGVLFATVPLWASRAGASSAGAGAINGVLMAATVATQTLIPWALRRLGWTAVLSIGLIALAVPGPLYLLSTDLPVLLCLSAVRGIGFGVITVCGSAAIAELTPPRMRGRAVGAYGLAIAFPQILTMTGAPWLAEKVGFGWVFALGALPILGLGWVMQLARALAGTQAKNREPDGEEGAGAAEGEPLAGVRLPSLLWLAVPAAMLTLATSAGGSVLTFLPQMIPGAGMVLAALFTLLVVAAVVRWWIGRLIDKRSSSGLAAPLFTVLALGLAGIALAAGVEMPPWLAWVALLAGGALLGAAYGGVQSLTLVQAFERAGAARSRTASAMWNVGFDAGTGLGSVLVGVIAGWYSYPAALGVLAVAAVLVVAGQLASRPGRARDEIGPGRAA